MAIRTHLRASGMSTISRLSPLILIATQRQGKLGHCLAADLVEEFGASEQVQDSLAVLYFGGVDTVGAHKHPIHI